MNGVIACGGYVLRTFVHLIVSDTGSFIPILGSCECFFGLNLSGDNGQSSDAIFDTSDQMRAVPKLSNPRIYDYEMDFFLNRY